MCFRWFAGGQGKEQEDGRRNGSCLPGYSEHVKTTNLVLPGLNRLKGACKNKTYTIPTTVTEYLDFHSDFIPTEKNLSF